MAQWRVLRSLGRCVGALASLALGAAWLVSGCNSGGITVEGGDDDSQIGSLALVIVWPTDLVLSRTMPGYTDTVDVSVRGQSDIGDFEIQREVTRADVVGTQAAISIPVPAGPARQVTAVARDAEGGAVAFGQLMVSITRGTTVQSILQLTPLASGEDSYPLPAIASYSAAVTTWTGNFGGSDPPQARVYVDLFGADGAPEVGRVVFAIHQGSELWFVQTSGEVAGSTISGVSTNADFLDQIPLTGGGVTAFGGYTQSFSGSLLAGTLALTGIDDPIGDDAASIVVTFAGGFGTEGQISGTITASASSSERLVGSFVCGGTVDDGGSDGGGGGPGVPNLTDQIGIHLDTFTGNFTASTSGDDDAGTSARQLTFSGLNGLAFIDIFAPTGPMDPGSASVTMVIHNDTELWQIRGQGTVTSPFSGSWVAPEHSVEYFTGFSSGIGGYTTDFIGRALDFSLTANSLEDPLVPGQGSFMITVTPDPEGDGESAGGSIIAETESGRTLIGSFSGTVVF